MSRQPYIPKATIETVLARVEARYGYDACEICGRTQLLELAHIKAKGMGGRHNAAKVENDDPSNIMRLCMLCHNWLSHHQRVRIGQHSCDTCWLQHDCERIAVERGLREPNN